MHDEFQTFLLNTGISRHTVDAYGRIVGWLIDDFPDPQHITAEQLACWIKEHRWGSTMQSYARAAVRHYVRWLYGGDQPDPLARPRRQERTASCRDIKPEVDLLDTTKTLHWALSVRQISLIEALQTFINTDLSKRAYETVVWYHRRLNQFAQQIGPDRPLIDIQEPDLLDWAAEISRRPLSSDTIRGHLRAVKRLFKWLTACGMLPANPALVLKLPKPQRYCKHGISDEDADRIMDASQANPRDYAIITFMADTGARRAGVATLTLDRLDLPRKRAFVIEKGEKERAVFLTDVAVAAMQAWLDERPIVRHSFVFCSQANADRGEALQPGAVTQLLRRYKAALHIKGRCSPHQWRHRLGRRLSQRNISLGNIAQIMGHDDPRVTVWFYGGFNVDDLQDIYNKGNH